MMLDITKKQFFTSIIAAFLIGLPAAAVAQDVIGQLNVSLNGEDRVWQTLRSTDPSVSFNTGVTEHGPIRSINIQGYDKGGSYTRDVMVISLSLMADGGMVDQSVMHVPDRMSQSWMNPDDEKLVTIEHIDEENIRGTISGRLCYKDGMTKPVDMDKCVPVEGTFETQLPLE